VRHLLPATGIGEGLTAAWHLFGALPVDTPRRVVDLVGDGPQNTGVPIASARAALLEIRATIDGLAADGPAGSDQLGRARAPLPADFRRAALVRRATDRNRATAAILRQKILLELF
jgi:hypothetical protein